MTWFIIFRINKRLNKEISHLIHTLPTVDPRGRQTKRNLQVCPPERVDEPQPELVRYLKQKQASERSFRCGMLPLQGEGVFPNLRSQMRAYFSSSPICLAWMYCEYQCQ